MICSKIPVVARVITSDFGARPILGELLYIDRKKENVIFTLLYLGDSLSDWNHIATELPASQGSLHTKFEGNRSSHFRDTSCQRFDFFLRVFAYLQKLL